MNSKTLRPVAPVLASALALMLAAGTAAAQEAAPAPARGPVAALLKLDTDGDGRITREEFNAPRVARMQALDSNQDGFVSLEEMKAEAVARATARAEAAAERRFRAMDADGDGKISAAEAMAAQGAEDARRGPPHGHGHGKGGPKGRPGPADHAGPRDAGGFPPALFDRLDKDGDGVLSAEELAAVQRHMERGPKGGPRPEHGGKGPRPPADQAPGADKPAAN